MKDKKLNVSYVAKLIGSPVADWPGACSTIANKMLENEVCEGKLRYGAWHGVVSPNCKLFYKTYKNIGWVRHGWIVKSDGSIVDPTRWVFEALKPYIYQGVNDCYDAGFNQIKLKNEKPAPAWDSTQRPCLDLSKMDDATANFIQALLDDRQHNVLSLGQNFWLANLSLSRMAPFEREIITALDKQGFGAHVPIDNLRMVLEK